MPTFYYVREIPFATSEPERALHRIAFPSYGEPGWYRQTRSVNAFRSGRQKGVSADARRRHYDGCGWDHEKRTLYSIKSAHDHEVDMKIMLESVEAASPEAGAKIRAMYAAVPVIDHASLYDFYDYIGFDRKTRRYKKGR